jgi:hypothetical protein
MYLAGFVVVLLILLHDTLLVVARYVLGGNIGVWSAFFVAPPY